jgi:type I restriction enzyme, S subunit
MTMSAEESPCRPLWAVLDRRDEFNQPDLQMLTVVSEHGVRVRDLSDGRTPGENLSGYRVVHPGDLVVNKMWARFGAYGVSTQSGIISPAYWILTPRAAVVEPRFLHHLLRSAPYRAEIWRRSKDLPPNGFDLPWDQFRTITVPVLPLATQRAIVDYLDSETERIDALVAAKRRMVELLKERLELAVSESTHAGVVMDPTHRLPSGWDLMPLKRCLTSRDYGIGESPQADGAYAVLGMTNVNSGEVVGTPGGFVSFLDEGLLLAPGDLLFNRTNSRELVGKVGLVRTIDCPTTFASYLVRLRVNGIADPGYLNYLLNAREVLGLARSMALPSIGQANLNPSRYSTMILPIPPIDEQRRRASHLNILAERTVDMTRMIERQIALLRERRRALITAAVTGQIDIAGAA